MKLKSDWISSSHSLVQEQLLRRMLSPFVGLDQMVGTVVRGRREPRLNIMGADLAGVHLLRGQPRPKAGAYHIGGSGVLLGEAIIRTCGETAERYAQLVSEYAMTGQIEYRSYSEMEAQGRCLVPPECFQYFSKHQLEAQTLGLQPFDLNSTLGWVPAFSPFGFNKTWVPAQSVLVGYVPKTERGEPWLYPCMTTGTAVHTSYPAAFRNALLELIQIDSAIGFWYTGRRAKAIILDASVDSLVGLIERSLIGTGIVASFFSFDFPYGRVQTIACILKSAEGYPEAVVGLGVELAPGQAMYKAFLEAAGVLQLAKITAMHDSAETSSLNEGIPFRDIYDLDHNVKYYGYKGQAELLNQCFDGKESIMAAELVTMSLADPRPTIAGLLADIHKDGIRLYVQDLSWHDIRGLGLRCVRVWSPDLLPMCLPSLPPAAHARFRAFGDFALTLPHPYA